MSQAQLNQLSAMYDNIVDKRNRLSEAERNLIATTESLSSLAKMILRKEIEK